jgi:hypothetical protein
MPKPEKATLLVLWDGPNDKSPEQIPVQYNPTELTFDKGVQLAEIAIPGLDMPLQQFVRGQAEKLSLDLFFDATDDGMGADASSVTKWTDKIYSLVKIVPETHAPPICVLTWNNQFPGHFVGSSLKPQMKSQARHNFQCVAESVKQKFTLFSTEGVPLRATLTVTFREYKTLEQQLHQLKLSSPDRTHSHVIQEGDALWRIADRYYNRPGRWRTIAEKSENGIEDPRRLTVGKFIEVPPL